MSSPTQRTLAFLRGCGYHADVAEKLIPMPTGIALLNRRTGKKQMTFFLMLRKDLHGFIDVSAVGPGGILAVQSCVTGDMSKRAAKILPLEAAREFVRQGGHVIVMGWALRGKRGERKRWTPRQLNLSCRWVGEELLWECCEEPDHGKLYDVASVL